MARAMSRIPLVLTLPVLACALSAEVAFDIEFLPDAGEPLTCSEAGVRTIRFSFFAEHSTNSTPLMRVSLPCRRDGQVLSIDPASYEVQVDGLDANGVVCYRDAQHLDLERAGEYDIDWAVTRDPEGEARGCLYP